jgi:hypothetical protein
MRECPRCGERTDPTLHYCPDCAELLLDLDATEGYHPAEPWMD